MTLRDLSSGAGEWLRGSGPHSDVVISSRIRLARNLAGFPFVNRANRRQRYEVLEHCRGQIMTKRLGDKTIWVQLADSPAIDRQLLVERHLISRDLARPKARVPRGVAVGHDETFSVMVNEEDHLRIQVFRSGMQISEAYDQINRIDDVLEEKLDFAFSRRFGYLTACPTNVGTGIRISVMMHLPALTVTGEIEKVKRAARDMHLAVRGLFGEGSEATGDFYQVSNQTTLGKTEKETIADFEASIIPQIITYEHQARQAMMRQREKQLDDKVHRAWAILNHARLLSTNEALQLLSHLRLGIHTGRLEHTDIRTVSELLLLCQPAHLQKVTGQEMTPAARRIARANLMRQRLGAGRGT